MNTLTLEKINYTSSRFWIVEEMGNRKIVRSINIINIIKNLNPGDVVLIK